jgi:hypothetical protein
MAPASYRNLYSNEKRFRQTACGDTITRFVPFSPEVGVTVSRRPALYLTCAFVFLFLTSLSLRAQKAEQSTAANPIDPKTYGGMKWRLIGPFRGGRGLFGFLCS